MKKTHDYRERESGKTCAVKGCPTRLKERLVEAKQPHNITICYTHYKDQRLRGISHRNALRLVASYRKTRLGGAE